MFVNQLTDFLRSPFQIHCLVFIAVFDSPKQIAQSLCKSNTPLRQGLKSKSPNCRRNFWNGEQFGSELLWSWLCSNTTFRKTQIPAAPSVKILIQEILNLMQLEFKQCLLVNRFRNAFVARFKYRNFFRCNENIQKVFQFFFVPVCVNSQNASARCLVTPVIVHNQTKVSPFVLFTRVIA